MRKYRWPFVLFIGVSFVAELSRITTTYIHDVSSSSNPGSHELSLWLPGVTSLVTALLLGVLYLRVRNVEPAILRLVWSCTLAIAVMQVPLYLGAVLAGYGDSLPQVLWVHTFNSVLLLPLLLWFARRASRLSLTHAFFLVFIIGGLALPALPGSLPFYFDCLWRLAASAVAVWLLSDYEARGYRFRRFATATVVAASGLLYLELYLGSLFHPAASLIALRWFPLQSVIAYLLFPMQLISIYLVRVRQPAAVEQS